MNKYLQILKISWQENFVYRLNFLMWRLRVVIRILAVYFLWHAVFQDKGEIFGYGKAQILTYILGISLMWAVVLASRSIDIAAEIHRGDLTLFLLKPINYFKYWFTRDIADKILNLFFAFFEIALIYFFLKPLIFWQANFWLYPLFFLSVFLSIILYFLLNLLLGFIAFWSAEFWAPRFLVYIFIEFLAGGIFPIDILPKPVFAVISRLPFSYLLYFPLKIYLGQLDFRQIGSGFLISLFWIFILFRAVKSVWQLGLSTYSAEGR